MRPLPSSAAHFACALALAVFPGELLLDARQQAPPRPSSAAVATAPAADAPDRDYRAEDTRRELKDLLAQFPPALHRVLQLDPALLNDAEYLAPYPALQAFVATHPEIARNPVYYLGQFDQPLRMSDPQMRVFDMWQEIAQSLTIFMVFLVVVGALGWLVRTLVDYRRWLRVSRVQADAHAKLLDRLTGNQELVAYVQSPAGQSFLQSAPIPLDAGPRSVGAPMGRILLSVQAGIVLAFAGLGLRWAAGIVGGDGASPLAVLGVLAAMLGIGFVVSAVIAYALARRLGLLERPSPALPVG